MEALEAPSVSRHTRNNQLRNWTSRLKKPELNRFSPQRTWRDSRWMLWIALAGVLAAIPAHAQVDDNANAWLMYFGDHPLNNDTRWGIHLEGQWRRAELGLNPQQLLLRPGVNFQVNDKLMLTGGYAFIQTHRYGDFPARAPFPEHRFFEQAIITQHFAALDWSHRLRLEQRNIGQMTPKPDGGFQVANYRYENRFRYMLRTNIPLPLGGGDKYYLGLYDEIMFNFGKNVANNVFDQNRAYVALGRNLPKQTKLEVGFLEQTVQQRDGRVFEHNHTLQVSITSRLPFGF